MRISTSIYLEICWLGFLLVFGLPFQLNAQLPDSLQISGDSVGAFLNMDATYNRPFLSSEKMPVAVGGYLEANSLYSSEDGVSEGLSFQARRLTLFMSASISNRIKFLSEIEFEDGTKEIAIEFAALDVSFHPLLNFRGGILMNPIGAFNQNHDGPKWEFVERPDVAVSMLPATWSNAGFGLYGKTYSGSWIVGYEAYLTNGFDNTIINNIENKTFLPATKQSESRFEENNSGRAMTNAKIAIKNRNLGEIGFSYMGGAYNKFENEGLKIDDKRGVHVFALDLNTTIKRSDTYITGEMVYAWIQVPSTYTQQFGNHQRGIFIDVVQPVVKQKILGWKDARFNVAARFDFVDWNSGSFSETDLDIGDELWAITPAVSFRPSSQTVFRLNYRYQWQVDLLNNPAAKTASWLFGFSSYF
ncbi:MAG: hypothetical protein IPL46_15950 [Saprospiraceae bacterium]|nr:hypothetical protein [Saprospiraceae bacterium]